MLFPTRSAFLVVAASLFGAVAAPAQNVAPVVSQQLPDTTIPQGTAAQTINLLPAFSDPDTRQAVRMTTVLGTIDVVLFDQQTPKTVANFLNYVNSGRYEPVNASSGLQGTLFFHRSVPGFVIQSGGFIETPTAADPTRFGVTSVQADAAVQNEPGISNLRGTIAMAKIGSDPNSATSQWFFNLGDNSANLDAQNGGFTVFGRVAGNGLTAVDAIAALPTYNEGSPFDQLPLISYDPRNPILVNNLVRVPAIAPVAPLQYSAVSDNTNVAVATVTGSTLNVAGSQAGNARVTVTATDLDGASVSQSFAVQVVAAPGHLANISTRLQVGTGDDVLIGGFIIRGGSKRVLVRAIGPSLTQAGVSGALTDPVLELHDHTGATIFTNDNWQTAANAQEISDSTLAPGDPKESAILTTLPADNYTAIVHGAGIGTGVGRVDVFDLDAGSVSSILNISTRGQVGSGNNVLIGGVILGGSAPTKVLIRGIGPSLQAAGVAGSLANPTVDLRDAQGAVVAGNDDWQTGGQAQQIQDAGLAPIDPRESALIATLPPGNYTAIVSGVGQTTGVALVEAYKIQ